MSKVLIVGSGAREHALAQTFLRSPQVDEVIVAPGNDGMAKSGITCQDIAVTELTALRDFARSQQIDLTFVGSEEPLTLGIVDVFEASGLTIFGPSKKAAQLEGSKSFTKNILKKYHIPTANAQTVTSRSVAQASLELFDFPVVFKLDGLALGKGVTIINNRNDGEIYLDELYQQQSDAKLVIEEYLDGVEFSVFTLVGRNGQMTHAPLAQDHKRRFDGDKGPNTGGMGAYSPVTWISDDIRRQTINMLVEPTVKAMLSEKIPFSGVLYTGVMLTTQGPKVIEFNVRFGDPEAQVVLPQYTGDFYDLIMQLLQGNQPTTKWQEEDIYLGVVLASPGYPEAPQNGLRVPEIPYPVNYAGVSLQNGQLVTKGGRVLTVVHHQKTIAVAQKQLYEVLDKIDMALEFRHDIGYQAVE
ncbi:phosphoribosylamine--glycine ligase [Leuconostoc pseudomesenteroides]|uniref:phosphoribosylamine--glycine ligase n=1 Tax=Leuconostoc TaxID=1243 RepID=UPI0011DDDC20|nr:MULTISPECIES: phosphoribosylamine--glycine ligase [Leuconostoc]MBK0039850.1 phosphoribosylamine--glycine ligase [Leuconostoc sp. S51]MBK0050809.1 phosphoribosylamine--glycine ligase [Leuconostoc sp. S50]MBS0957031.1 phosphoribosylamine--glycine ligase [Leuconostoc pseudomesenteroides]MCT4412419.1 phosphoribosylamine--glycine ligase [Leuconostoc pseudomesenteroides]